MFGQNTGGALVPANSLRYAKESVSGDNSFLLGANSSCLVCLAVSKVGSSGRIRAAADYLARIQVVVCLGRTPVEAYLVPTPGEACLEGTLAACSDKTPVEDSLVRTPVVACSGSQAEEDCLVPTLGAASLVKTPVVVCSARTQEVVACSDKTRVVASLARTPVAACSGKTQAAGCLDRVQGEVCSAVATQVAGCLVQILVVACSANPIAAVDSSGRILVEGCLVPTVGCSATHVCQHA